MLNKNLNICLLNNFIYLKQKAYFLNITYYNDIYTYKIHLMDHTNFNTLNTCFNMNSIKEDYNIKNF